MAKIIIGIPGLANKPTAEVLFHGWQAALQEGLRHIEVREFELPLSLVYWANRLYKQPLHNDPLYMVDTLYDREPYIPARPGDLRYYQNRWRDVFQAEPDDPVCGACRHTFGDNAAEPRSAKKIIKELRYYCDPEQRLRAHSGQLESAGRVLENDLEKVILAHQNDDIMLIAHSMGSIIAFNVLHTLGRLYPDLRISQWITMGTPLGLPLVRAKIAEDPAGDAPIQTPSVITGAWINYADPQDPISVGIRLNGVCQANRRGIMVQDKRVRNDYHVFTDCGELRSNPHKSYGYLRSPELAQQVARFLAA